FTTRRLRIDSSRSPILVRDQGEEDRIVQRRRGAESAVAAVAAGAGDWLSRRQPARAIASPRRQRPSGVGRAEQLWRSAEEVAQRAFQPQMQDEPKPPFSSAASLNSA